MKDREILVNMIPATSWGVVLLNTQSDGKKNFITIPVVAWANVEVEIEKDDRYTHTYNKIIGIMVFDEDGPMFIDPMSMSNYVGYIQDHEIPEQKFGDVLEKK